MANFEDIIAVAMGGKMLDISDMLKELGLTDIQAIDEYGNTGLHLAVQNETFTQKKIIAVLKILLDRGIDPNIKNNLDKTVLQLAFERRMNHVIDFLFTRNVRKDSLLVHFWIQDEYTKFQRLLSQQNNEMGSEILKMEIESASFVEWLMSRGFDFYSRIEGGPSAFYLAIEYNLQHILPVLFKFCINISIVDGEKKTLLHLFLEKSTVSRRYDHYSDVIMDNWYSNRFTFDIVKTLLVRGLSVDAEDKYNVTPMEIAVKQQADVNVIEILLERCANIHRKDIDNQTLLTTAIMSSLLTKRKTDYYLKIIPLMMAKGADIRELNMPDKFGRIPVWCAVEKQNIEVIKFLGDNGVNFCIATKDGETLLYLLAKKKCVMLDEDAETLINLLIGNGCQVNAKDVNGNTPLYAAVNSENTAIARKLIEHGANINCRNNRMATPLHFAVEHFKSIEVIEFLLKQGAYVDAKNSEGQTISHMIALGTRSTSNTDILRMLLTYGADLNTKEANGQTVLSCARMRDSADHIYIPLHERVSDVVVLLTEHAMKLKVAKLPLNKEISAMCEDVYTLIVVRDIPKIRSEMLSEVGTLKSTFIDKSTSLYTFLHVNVNRRCVLLNNEKLKNIVDSRVLEEQFPRYASVILAHYREATTRKLLLEEAKEGWVELTNIALPDLCLECIFSFLGNSDIFNFIRYD